jgi:TldD protein
MLEKNGRKETGVYGVGGRQSYDEYLKMIIGKMFVKKH